MTFSLIFPSAFQDVGSLVRVAFIWRMSCGQSRSSTLSGFKKQTGRQSSWKTLISAWTASETLESKKFRLDWRIPTATWKLSSESFRKQYSSLQYLLRWVGRTVCYNILFCFSLSHCSLTDDCCAELASGCASKESIISELDLSCNEIQDKGVRKLCTGLRSPQCKLEKLS